MEGTATPQNAEKRTHEVVSFQIVVLDVELERDLCGNQMHGRVTGCFPHWSVTFSPSSQGKRKVCIHCGLMFFLTTRDLRFSPSRFRNAHGSDEPA